MYVCMSVCSDVPYPAGMWCVGPFKKSECCTPSRPPHPTPEGYSRIVGAGGLLRQIQIDPFGKHKVWGGSPFAADHPRERWPLVSRERIMQQKNQTNHIGRTSLCTQPMFRGGGTRISAARLPLRDQDQRDGGKPSLLSLAACSAPDVVLRREIPVLPGSGAFRIHHAPLTESTAIPPSLRPPDLQDP